MPATAKVALETTDAGRFVWQLGWLALFGFLIVRVDILAILACLLLSVCLFARLLAKRGLKNLDTRISLPSDRARCGEETPIQVSLSNRSRIFPIFYPTLDVKEPEDHRIHKIHYKGAILPQATVTLPSRFTFQKRGENRLCLATLHCFFPFGFYHATRLLERVSDPILVWPRALPTSLQAVLRYQPTRKEPQSGQQSRHPDDTDSALIRDYQTGDPRRLINWKLTAKADKPMVIESKAQKEPRFELRFTTARAVWRTDVAFERALSRLVAILPDLLKQRRLIGLAIDDSYFPLSNPADSIKVYDALALAQLSDTAPQPPDEEGQRFLSVLPDPTLGIVIKRLSKDLAHAR
ncbi:DUF58 domain-containing protein [Pelagicoccus sp. SDUM812003]|uniref:DUF58 domain-containing protein n=1 Tax=Pelagicoccus sp. SDUM812003 TaxID=3041267 RepID=UPI0028107DF7|nr:DUF58 domain-containing protein [Pelagicoccus sp. SDUM812003]MDQ8202487.1 DUF58 domain-containing protein [Pelagicoccus sp. SDUM812003]